MIIRSPKWLRNIIDFEISTGEDIKGDPSKKRARKIKFQKWYRRWHAMMNDYDLTSKFKDFYKEKYGWRGYLYSSDLPTIKDRWEGNMQIWSDFDYYLNQKIREEQRQERIKRELDNLWRSIMNDYKYNKYIDKVETKTDRWGKVYKIIYKFENGKTVTMSGDKLEYNNMQYTMGLIYNSKFVNLFNIIVEDINKGNAKQRARKQSEYSYTGKKKSGNSKRDLYETILETINQREHQLKGMGKNDPDRSSLENELNTAKKQAEKIKEKYGL